MTSRDGCSNVILWLWQLDDPVGHHHRKRRCLSVSTYCPKGLCGYLYARYSQSRYIFTAELPSPGIALVNESKGERSTCAEARVLTKFEPHSSPMVGEFRQVQVI